MTREEAIRYLDVYSSTNGSGLCTDKQHYEAKQMAIKALEQESTYYPPCTDCNKKMDEIRRAYDKLKEQEPCEDCISRQAVLDIVDSYSESRSNVEDVTQDMISDIMVLPSVNPQEPKTGHWIAEDMFDGDVAYRCSECKELFWIESGTPKDNEYNFCPKCGARMVEPQESDEV